MQQHLLATNILQLLSHNVAPQPTKANRLKISLELNQLAIITNTITCNFVYIWNETFVFCSRSIFVRLAIHYFVHLLSLAYVWLIASPSVPTILAIKFVCDNRNGSGPRGLSSTVSSLSVYLFKVTLALLDYH